MPKFSTYFRLNSTQHQLDFVDVSNDYDTPVYVDPYAIEINDDIWAEKASELIRIFFKEVLDSIRAGDKLRAQGLMSHLHEPKETFLGVSKGSPKGRGVGARQSNELIKAIAGSKAFKTGILGDLSEMALYVEGVDKDKISDLTTNIIRSLLITYTNEQCQNFGIETLEYNGPPIWDGNRKNWISKKAMLPYIDGDPIILVPKYIVRRQLSLNSQEFYNKQITDFFVQEAIRATSSLVQTLKGGKKVQKITKSEVREKHPKDKEMIAELVRKHPELLQIYKDIAKKHPSLVSFEDTGITYGDACRSLINVLKKIPVGASDANNYHTVAMGILTLLFYPLLIQPHKEWEIDDGRKRADIVFTNSANDGFFSQRRDDSKTNANTVIFECKNYKNDIENPEIDQLLGRFDNNRGKFGIITCRSIDNEKLLLQRCRDLARKERGYIITLTDDDLVKMLEYKSEFKDNVIEEMLYKKFRDIIA